jgi:hypothetical protein
VSLRRQATDRGLKTPLSPHEEVSLRRVALGISQPADLPVRDITRLKALSLIEEHGAGLRLTPLGRERYLALPNSSAINGEILLQKFVEAYDER